MTHRDRFKVVSMFSGCGGLDYGFIHPPFDLVGAYDNDPAAVQCFSHNLPCSAKLMDVSSPAFLEEIKGIGWTDVLLGGFPCQGFSKSGPKKEGIHVIFFIYRC